MQKLDKNITNSIFIVAIALSTACSNHKVTATKVPFAITDSLLSRLIIDTVQQANHQINLNFSAKITANEERKSELFPMVSGMVNHVAVRLGDRVISGQILASINSSEMAGFDKDMIAANAALKNAERSLKQADQLFQSGLSSAKDLEEAKNDYQIKKAEVKRANSVLKLNGGSNTGTYAIKAPISGFLIDKNVTDNMQLRGDNDKSMFTIADLSTVWAIINIYESDVSKIKAGDAVSLSTLSYPDKNFFGKIDKVYNQIDSESKVMNARVVIPNPGFLLKPGMLGTVQVTASSDIDYPMVNSRAVIFDDNKNYVLVISPNQKVSIQEIEIGRKAGDQTYISKGIKAQERVISSKQVFLFENLKAQ